MRQQTLISSSMHVRHHANEESWDKFSHQNGIFVFHVSKTVECQGITIMIKQSVMIKTRILAKSK